MSETQHGRYGGTKIGVARQAGLNCSDLKKKCINSVMYQKMQAIFLLLYRPKRHIKPQKSKVRSNYCFSLNINFKLALRIMFVLFIFLRFYRPICRLYNIKVFSKHTGCAQKSKPQYSSYTRNFVKYWLIFTIFFHCHNLCNKPTLSASLQYTL